MQDRLLFPAETIHNAWQQFRAVGFFEPACGVLYRLDRYVHQRMRRKRPNGMPLGGIDTGCIDLEKNGTLGLMTIFNSHVPRRGPLNLPFLGVSVGRQTWVLADLDHYHVSVIGHETVYYFSAENEGDDSSTRWSGEEYLKRLDWRVRGVEELHYWGHYPVADMEYELTEFLPEPAPGSSNYMGGNKTPSVLSVGVRAWSPFVPGDVDASMIPGVIFEVRLRNTGAKSLEGAVAFTFPGPSLEEAEDAPGFPHQGVTGKLSGVHVTNGRDIGYAVGAIGETVRTGGELGTNGQAWSEIRYRLPRVLEGQPGSSVAVDFEIPAGTEKVVRFVLAWYSPIWRGGGTLASGGNAYRHMYSLRYHNAVEVAERLAAEHQQLLRRVLAWQQVVYCEDTLPIWLRESLVNVLHLLTEDSLWATAEPPIGEWCRHEDGLFALNECPQDCPQIECIPCTFYGNMPLVYFFPQLALSTLRGFKAYQNGDGSIPFNFSRPPTIELAHDFSEKYEVSTNGPCYVELVDRSWQRSGSDAVLREFYDSVKRNVIFTMNLNPGPDGVISAPVGNFNRGDGWVRPLPEGKGIKFGGEHNGVFGMSSHLGGLHLAQLRQAQRMADHMGDVEFARRCQEWIEQGSRSLEEKLWTGTHYLNYWEPETGRKSDLIYAYQLIGEWMARYHGLSGVFPADRVFTTLETIRRVNMPLTKFGAVMFARPEGTLATSAEVGYGAYNMFTSESILLGATCMYAGEVELGLELVRRHWENIVCRLETTWEMPNLLTGDADTGEMSFGSDYYQNMALWVLPAAVAGEDLASAVRPGGLIDRIIAAGRGGEHA